MQVREAREEEVEAVCGLLEAAFSRPDEARLFGTLWGDEALAAALVAVGTPSGDGGDGSSVPEWDNPGGRRAELPGMADGAGAAAEGGEAEGRSESDPVNGIAVLTHLVSPGNSVGLGPLAVRPDYSDRGIGKALIAACIRHAREAGHDAIFVLGQPPYYTRFGFSVEAARPFRSEYPAEYLMALELKPGALAEGGELRYAPAFAGL